MSILGNRVLRKEDPKFLTTGGTYVDDLDIEGAAHVTYVRSTIAHARITSIDVDEARAAPGVLGVFTADDIDLAPEPASIPIVNQDMRRPFLARDVVRFVGEPVVAVVTEEKYQGADAAEMVWIDYDPLPALVDPEAALESDTVLFPEVGSNVCLELAFGRRDDLFADCDVVVEQRMVNQRVAPCPLEVRAAASRWEDDGRLTHWASTQAPHSVRDKVARVYGLDPDQVRVIAPDVGGGFGAKIGDYPEETLLPALARLLGRPVKFVETRSESMVALGHGRAQVQQVQIGGTRDGRITAYRLEVIQDAGAYPGMGAVLPYMTRTMLTGVYDIPAAEFNCRSVVTTTTPTTAYRGAGRPEATAAIERAIDIYAAEIGIDPAEVRRRNLVAPDAFPFRTPVGTTYDCGDYERALDLALDAAGYAELRAEQARRRTDPDATTLLGIGVCAYVEITGGAPDTEFGSVEITSEGKAVVRTGTSPHGQGHVTAWSMLVSEQLGIPLDDIEVIHGDTDQVPHGIGTMGSRSLQRGGVAVNQAAGEVVEQAKRLAADLLEAAVDDIVLDPAAGVFHVAGAPAVSRDWTELAAASTDSDPLRSEVMFRPESATFPFGAHVSVVEVDRETGRVEILRHVACDDAGRILNPLLAEGQVHGGVAQGIAQALLEEFRYDDDGNPVTANLADYAFVTAAELPSFELVSMETPTPVNELGAKGIGESGTIGSTPAVQNAVVDALASLGVRHIDMPVSPERVWSAIEAAR